LAVNQWWRDDPAEIYFLETTDRSDIGVDLRAPVEDDAHHAHHAYALVPHVRPGDIIFHYRKPVGIVGWSRAAGAPFRSDIVWGARGRVAQKAGVKPYNRPRWSVPLEGPFMLDEAVTLADLRAYEPAIRAAVETAEAQLAGGTLYRPFQLSDLQPLRGTQHYLTKLPLGVILAVPILLAAADEAGNAATVKIASAPVGPLVPSQTGLGQDYISADEEAASADRDLFTVDPAVVDRGVKGHATTQNALAAFLTAQSLEPRSPRSREPQYDLAWRDDGQVFVAEVKSLTAANEERQLRLGLGRVLRYRHVLSLNGDKVTGVLATEREPLDETWHGLCKALGIRLAWPPHFNGLA
jgi:hypothetical protein